MQRKNSENFACEVTTKKTKQSVRTQSRALWYQQAKPHIHYLTRDRPCTRTPNRDSVVSLGRFSTGLVHATQNIASNYYKSHSRFCLSLFFSFNLPGAQRHQKDGQQTRKASRGPKRSRHPARNLHNPRPSSLYPRPIPLTLYHILRY